jgi:TonB family protein
MIRMTFISVVGHVVGFCFLLFLSWYQPPPRVQRGEVQRIRFPKGSGPGAGGPRTPGAASVATPPPATPKVSTPEPVKTVEAKKTIERQPKKSPTPEASKTAKAKTPTPAKTKAPTPAKTPAKTITPTKTAAIPEAAKTPSATAPKASPGGAATPKASATPAQGGADSSAGPIMVSGTKQGTGSNVPGVPDGTGPPGTPLSDFDYYRYMAQMKIEQNFTVPRHLRAAGITCLMKFWILRDGRITNIRMIQSTNDSILDGFAQRALETTEQLGPFPDTLKEDSIELTVIFDYSMPEEGAKGRE